LVVLVDSSISTGFYDAFNHGGGNKKTSIKFISPLGRTMVLFNPIIELLPVRSSAFIKKPIILQFLEDISN